jgi:hypothetical protein
MAAVAEAEVHHRTPRCLLGLSREGLLALIDGSVRELPATEHRGLHQQAGDFAPWGRRGGLRILALYGRPYFSLLARLRWDRVELETLTRYRARMCRLEARRETPR